MTLRARLTRLERAMQADADTENPWLDDRRIVPYCKEIHESPDHLRGQIEWLRARADRCQARHPDAAAWWMKQARCAERELARAMGQPVCPPRDWIEAINDGMDLLEARQLFRA